MSIKGGYYLKARSIQNSKIAVAPPYIREIWDWILKEANHKDNSVCKRGQLVRTFKDMQDGLKWYAGWRKETYTKDQCEKAMVWLRKETMIATTKTTRGLIINVLNYDKFQNPTNYESNNENYTKATQQQQSADTINKNDKNVKNDNNIFNIPSLEEVKTYCLERKNKVDPEAFINFYESKGWMIGKNKMKDWRAAVRTWETNMSEEKSNRVKLHDGGYAIMKFGSWVLESDNAVKLDSHYYPELNKN